MVAGGAGEAEASVRRILDDVQARGDAAVCEYTRQFDKADVAPAALRVPEDAIEAAYKSMPREFIQTVTRIRDSVRRFQRHAMHRGRKPLVRDGRTLRLMYRPLARVGVYVPGGKAFYPSTVLMTAVPALAAGVPEVAVASPPTAGGDIHPSVLATCRVAGVSEVYRMGGVQAIAALAYGTETVRPVEKIVGPGNAYVQLAKRLVFGRVDIDSFAGPSEVIVLADDFGRCGPRGRRHAEPGRARSGVGHPRDARRGAGQGGCRRGRETGGRPVSGPRPTRAAIEKYSAIVLVADMVEAVETATSSHPSTWRSRSGTPEEVLQGIRCAGAVFLGRYTPVAVGDYVAGPSHTLPTGGTARWASGLTANDFLRSMSVVEFTARPWPPMPRTSSAWPRPRASRPMPRA